MKCEYICGNCGATGCKLWRGLERTRDPYVLCINCFITNIFCIREHVENMLSVKSSWMNKLEALSRMEIIPAIPYNFQDHYWKGTAVATEEEWEWWEALPLEAFMFPKILELT